MKHIRNPKSIHAMNRYVSEMAHPKLATCHDVDAVYHNHIKDFWCMFEWKWESEKMCKPGTLQSLHDMDVALNAGSPNYRGLFIVRLNFPEEFSLDDTQACKIQHIWGGFVEGHQVYTENARTAIQHILDHGKLLS
jgi:myo-inositol catabolism protein IolC